MLAAFSLVFLSLLFSAPTAPSLCPLTGGGGFREARTSMVGRCGHYKYFPTLLLLCSGLLFLTVSPGKKPLIPWGDL